MYENDICAIVLNTFFATVIMLVYYQEKQVICLEVTFKTTWRDHMNMLLLTHHHPPWDQPITEHLMGPRAVNVSVKGHGKMIDHKTENYHNRYIT